MFGLTKPWLHKLYGIAVIEPCKRNHGVFKIDNQYLFAMYQLKVPFLYHCCLYLCLTIELRGMLVQNWLI